MEPGMDGSDDGHDAIVVSAVDSTSQTNQMTAELTKKEMQPRIHDKPTTLPQNVFDVMTDHESTSQQPVNHSLGGKIRSSSLAAPQTVTPSLVESVVSPATVPFIPLDELVSLSLENSILVNDNDNTSPRPVQPETTTNKSNEDSSNASSINGNDITTNNPVAAASLPPILTRGISDTIWSSSSSLVAGGGPASDIALPPPIVTTTIPSVPEQQQQPQPPTPRYHPLHLLTTAVARELDILPQHVSTREEPQPWVYHPAHDGVQPIKIHVYDPDGLWTFMESPITLETRKTTGKPRGIRRCVFVAHEMLKMPAPETLTMAERYQAPYLHLCLVRCETLVDYQATTRQRLRAFVDDVERRDDREWLLVVVESHKESQKVFAKVASEFGKTKCCSASVFDARRDNQQWTLLARMIAECISRAHAARITRYEATVANLSQQETIVPGWNFCSFVTAVECLAFAHIQADDWTSALTNYDFLRQKLDELEKKQDPMVMKMIRSGMEDPATSKQGMRLRPTITELLFPTLSNATSSEDSLTWLVLPARILDVNRLPFRDCIGTSMITALELVLYLFSRRVLLLLALSKPAVAARVACDEMMSLVKTLKRAYGGDKNHLVIDSWFITSCLELVAAGHACGTVFASDVDPKDRVQLCLAQATLLERCCETMEAVSRRDAGPTRFFIHDKILNDLKLPPGMARVMSSPEAFRGLYAKLLQAAAAHYVASGRFRFAARLSHRRALAETEVKDVRVLLEDSSRWWGGTVRSTFFEITPPSTQSETPAIQFHDDWPVLRAETLLCQANRGIESLSLSSSSSSEIAMLRLCECARHLPVMVEKIITNPFVSLLTNGFLNGRYVGAVPLILNMEPSLIVGERCSQLSFVENNVSAPLTVTAQRRRVYLSFPCEMGNNDDLKTRVLEMVGKVSITYVNMLRSLSPDAPSPSNNSQTIQLLGDVGAAPNIQRPILLTTSGTVVGRVAVAGYDVHLNTLHLNVPEGIYHLRRAHVTISGKDVEIPFTPSKLKVIKARFPVLVETEFPSFVVAGAMCDSLRSCAHPQPFFIHTKPAFEGARPCEGTITVTCETVGVNLWIAPKNVASMDDIDFMLPARDRQGLQREQTIRFACGGGHDEPIKLFLHATASEFLKNAPNAAAMQEIQVAHVWIKVTVDGVETEGRAYMYKYTVPVRMPLQAISAAYVRGDAFNVLLSVTLSPFGVDALPITGFELKLFTSDEERVLAPIIPVDLSNVILKPDGKVLMISSLFEAPRGLLAERPGGRSLVPLRACAVLGDGTKIWWDIPVLLKRAKLVRGRWEDGAGTSPSLLDLTGIAPLDEARIGDQWVDVDELQSAVMMPARSASSSSMQHGGGGASGGFVGHFSDDDPSEMISILKGDDE